MKNLSLIFIAAVLISSCKKEYDTPPLDSIPETSLSKSLARFWVSSSDPEMVSPIEISNRVSLETSILSNVSSDELSTELDSIFFTSSELETESA